VFSPESTDFSLEPFNNSYDRSTFKCGSIELERYLQKFAKQDFQRNLAISYIAFDKTEQRIIGYYTLSSQSIDLEELPQNLIKKLPKYPLIGVTLIGRLAVSIDYQGQGWGKLLLLDALYKSFKNSQQIASFAVIIEAKDNEAIAFYQRFDFQQFPNQPNKLFRTMKKIAQGFSE
jgi:ribosomal protein S18 acetylase RimI-like enzyme